MKQPRLRDTLSIGEKNGYASYESLTDGIRDIVQYWKYFALPLDFPDLKNFVASLHNKGYFTADLDRYYDAVLRHYKSFYND